MGFKCRFKGPENNHFFHSKLPVERQSDGQGQVRAGHSQLAPQWRDRRMARDR